MHKTYFRAQTKLNNMKKTNYLYKSIKLAGLAVLVFASSCKKDELKSKELLVYLQGDKAGIATHTQTIPFVHNPVAISGNTNVEVSAYASREVPANIDVYIEPDTKLVDAYNQQNATSSLELPAGAYQVTNTNKHSIQSGTLKSDPMKIEITHPEMLTNPAGYILPLTITQIQSKDKGAGISSTNTTVYLKVTYEFNNIASNQTPLTGTLMSRTGWAATVSNTTSGALGPAMLDGSNTTSWRSSNSSSAAKWAVINIASAQTIKGFQIVPNYVSASENATKMTISSSMDNTNWTVQGTWNGTGPATGSSAANPDIKGVNFVAPVNARYFKFEINTWVSGNRVGFAEVNGVQ